MEKAVGLIRRGSDRSIATKDSAARTMLTQSKVAVLDPLTAVPAPVPVLCTIAIGARVVSTNEPIDDIIANGDRVRLGR